MSTYLELNPELTATQIALRDETHRFAAEVTRPASVALDKLADPEDVIKDGSPFWDVFRKFHELERHLARDARGIWAAPTCAASTPTSSAEEMGWGAADFAIGLGASAMPFSMALLSPR